MQERLAKSLAQAVEVPSARDEVSLSRRILGANGSAIAVWWPEVGMPEFRAQHVEASAFMLPVNMMFVDRDGEAARAGGRANGPLNPGEPRSPGLCFSMRPDFEHDRIFSH